MLISSLRAASRQWEQKQAITPPALELPWLEPSVVERSLTLAPPHQPVHVVGPEVVLGEPEPEVPCVGIAMAGESGRLAVEVDLRRLVEPRHIAAEHVLEPADHPHPATVCRR